VSEARVIEVLPIETRIGTPGRDEWRALNGKARAGNMFLGPEWLLPWWSQFGEGRELATICVDSSEFVVSKLKDRGTHQAYGVVTNAQDFMAVLRLHLERGSKR